MRVCHPAILASAGTASFCLIIAAESHDKAWGTKKYISTKHQQKNTQTMESDHCPGFSCCTLTTWACRGNPVLYGSFSSVNKTPQHKPKLKKPPKPKSPAPRRSERFIMFVCQLLPPSCSKSHRIPANVGPAPEWKGLRGALWSAGPHWGQPQRGLPGFPHSSPAATSAEFAPLSLVCTQAVRSLLGAGPPWS